MCVCVHFLRLARSLVVLDLDQGRKMKKRKQSSQSDKFKLLSMVNESRFVAFRSEKNNSHSASANNDKGFTSVEVN